MPVQTVHRFSTKDYHRMAETGLLKPSGRVELLEGQIIDMSPIGPFHGSVTKRLNLLFTELSHGRWVVAVQDPVHLNEHSEPQPDLMLLKPTPDFYRNSHPRPQHVFLLIEVADTSLDYDRGQKIPAYAQAAISEVWLLNLIDQTLEIFRDPGPAGYESTILLHAKDQANPAAFPDVVVEL